MNRFDLPPEVFPFGEKVTKPTPAKLFSERNPGRIYKPYAPGMEVNGLGQLRTCFTLPLETVGDTQMKSRDALSRVRLTKDYVNGDWDISGDDVIVGADYGSGRDYTAVALRKGSRIVGGIRVPNPEPFGSTLNDIADHIERAVALRQGDHINHIKTWQHDENPRMSNLLNNVNLRQQAAAQADAATRGAPVHRQLALSGDWCTNAVPRFAVTRRSGIDMVPASELTEREVTCMLGSNFDSPAHLVAWRNEYGRMWTYFTVQVDGVGWTANLRSATDQQIEDGYFQAKVGSDIETKLYAEVARRGIIL